MSLKSWIMAPPLLSAPKKIAANTGFAGTTKTYAFQPNGELVDSAVVIYLYKDQGGKFVLQGRVKDLLAKA